VLYDSRVKEIYTDCLEYITDVEPGTSGSPVLNAQWQLAALHHSVLLDVDDDKADAATPAIALSCLGTRISRVVADLDHRLQANPTEKSLSDFLSEFVIRLGRTPPNRGRIFLLAGRRREIEVEPDQEAAWMKDIGEQVAALFPQKGFKVILVPTDLADDAAIAWINDQGYQAGDIALDLRMNLVRGESKYKEDLRGISAIYVGVNAERKTHADILLRSLLKQVPDLRDRGARSDWSESPNGLPFCRKVLMPSLVLYLGFLTNAEDQALVSDAGKRLAIAHGISNGLVRWGSTLSPIPILPE
jgi:hypothetical protein